MKKTILMIMACLTIAAGSQGARKSDIFTTKSGKEVKMTCIKHASIQIEYDGLQIQVDPVVDAVQPTTNYRDFPKANIILVTHEHHDHFDREAIATLRTPSTGIYLNPAAYSMFKNGIVMKNGDSISYRSDVTIKAVPAYNTTEGREQYHPQGRDNGYILTLDGLRIYIAGDTEVIPEMQQLGDIDIAFLPCNQPYTMTIDQLIEAAKIVKPKVLFPYHYSKTPIQQVTMKMINSDIKVLIRDYQ